MKRVLYVNYMIQYGHVNFDSIHINSLIDSGYILTIAVHSKIANRLQLNNDVCLFKLPKWLGFESDNGIVNRLMYILTLFYLRLHFNFSLFDKVIVSNIDEISLGLMPLTVGMEIICHGVADGFRSNFKKYFLKKLSHKNNFIVFNDDMTIPFHKEGINNVHVISHGCMPPFMFNEEVAFPIDAIAGKRMIFHPSNRPNQQFVETLLTSESLQNLLNKWDAYILLRDKSGVNKSHGRVIVITQYLSTSEYRNLMLESDIILLAYPDDFRYRVSGVSYECFSNKKKMLILNNPSFEYCRDFFNYNPLFRDEKDMEDKIDILFSKPDLSCIIDANKLKPDYSKIL